jgi:hypothetical protein
VSTLHAPGAPGPGVLAVPCHMSERWLQFVEREQYEAVDEDLMRLAVMTLDDGGRPYKLCELVVARGDLLRAVAAHGEPSVRTPAARRGGAAGAAMVPVRAARRSAAHPAGEQTELGG